MAGRALPPAALATLRELFADEVATRLPAMQSAAATMLSDGDLDAARALRTHAHTLGSSSAILGESLACRHARACEALLDPWCESTVPHDVALAAAAEVEAVALLLAPWLAGAA